MEEWGMRSFLMILSTNSEISKKKKKTEREREWEERVIDQI